MNAFSGAGKIVYVPMLSDDSAYSFGAYTDNFLSRYPDLVGKLARWFPVVSHLQWIAFLAPWLWCTYNARVAEPCAFTEYDFRR